MKQNRQAIQVNRHTEESKLQAEMRAALRADSCIDRSVPLGFSFAAKPEVGPTPSDYYRRRHDRGEFGRFFPLHTLTVSAPRRLQF